ncbi:Three-deoxy-D-manno-octulosonic-acid transferase-like protein [Rhodobacteraceae bacterium HTCC2150]|nr:Three-deoxy-D-manno-octulosonic-acid transferase-like protein [Rhodobacteraceae bacterium HTCC2150]
MGRSVGLAFYLMVSARLRRMGDRTLARRLSAGKEDADRIDERHGIAGLPRPKGTLIWFHCASVGEVLSIQELIKLLSYDDPNLSFLLTTGTKSSADLMTERMPPRCQHQYIPIDIVPYVQSFLDHWKPDLAIWTESELWPALITLTHDRKIPMLLLNARMSKESASKWRWLPGFAKSILSRFDHIMAQDDVTHKNLMRLGAKKETLELTGSLKEGASAPPCDEQTRADLAAQINGRPLWFAASTHEGEEAIVAKAHAIALRSTHRLLLIVAPRHIERGPEIFRDLQETGLHIGLRSRGDKITTETQIYVADTMGEMGLWYRLSPISFLGGSLAKIGGHNPFEPASLGSAILHGPFVFNFAEIFARLKKVDASKLVHNEKELATAVQYLLSPERTAQMAHAAWEISSVGAEITERAVSLIFETLDQKQ